MKERYSILCPISVSCVPAVVNTAFKPFNLEVTDHERYAVVDKNS